MGASQSNQTVLPGETYSQHGITVVNAVRDRPNEQADVTLPSRVPPIMTVDGSNIDPERHKLNVQLDPQIWVDIVLTIKEFMQSRADLIATRQSHLREKISTADELVQDFTDSYVNDKHKALVKLNENNKELEDLNEMLKKSITQSELCVDMLNKLNTLLPEEHRAQPLEI